MFLKPNKANVIGTALLLVANWTAGFVSRLVLQVARSGSDVVATGGRGSFAGAGAAQFGGTQYGGLNILSGATNLVILAVLFYVIVSFVAEKLVNAQEPAKKKETEGCPTA